MTEYAYTVLWPGLTALLASLCLVLVHRFIAHRWPKRRLLATLFEKDFRERHPGRFVIAWMAVVCLWLICVAVLYSIAETTAH